MILGKEDYISVLKAILNDTSKFTKTGQDQLNEKFTIVKVIALIDSFTFGRIRPIGTKNVWVNESSQVKGPT